MSCFRRIDHLICEVPDIERSLAHVHEQLGFPIAWPIGRFWPQGRTCGVALGGANLEFVQPDGAPPADSRITTIAFEPADLGACASELGRLGLPCEIAEKWESDPRLLRLRGFSEAQSSRPQLICTNLYCEDLPFFACQYSPELKLRLAPERFDVAGGNSLLAVHISAPRNVLEILSVLAADLIGPRLVASESELVRIRLEMKHPSPAIAF